MWSRTIRRMPRYILITCRLVLVQSWWTKNSCVWMFDIRPMGNCIKREIRVCRSVIAVRRGRFNKTFSIWNYRSVRRSERISVDRRSRWKKVDQTWICLYWKECFFSHRLEMRSQTSAAMIIGIVVTCSFLILVISLTLGVFCCRTTRKARSTTNGSRCKENIISSLTWYKLHFLCLVDIHDLDRDMKT